jgi:hypothetical protein
MMRFVWCQRRTFGRPRGLTGLGVVLRQRAVPEEVMAQRAEAVDRDRAAVLRELVEDRFLVTPAVFLVPCAVVCVNVLRTTRGGEEGAESLQ